MRNNIELYEDDFTDDELTEFWTNYYNDLEEFERLRQKDDLEQEIYTFISQSDSKEHKIPMTYTKVDAIGIRAIPNDIDDFIKYLKLASTSLFKHEKNKNYLMNQNSEYFHGIGFYGGVRLEFKRILRANNKYNVNLTIYPHHFYDKPQLLQQFKDEFLSHFDMNDADKWELSRLDIAFTMFKDLSEYYFHKKSTQSYESFYRVKQGSKGAKKLETAAVGSRGGSNFYYRMYDKMKQSGTKNNSNRLDEVAKTFPHIWRFEVEIKKGGLKKWRNCLQNCTLRRPNYLGDETLKPNEKVMIAGFLADNSLFSIVSRNTAHKYRNLISSMQTDDDMMPQLKIELKNHESRIIDTVKKWVNIDI